MRFRGCREKGVTSESTKSPARLVSSRLGSAQHGTARLVVFHDDGCGTRSRRAKTLPRRLCAPLRERDLTMGPTNGRPAGYHEAGARLDARDHDAHARGKADPTAQTGAKERRFDGAAERARGARRGLI